MTSPTSEMIALFHERSKRHIGLVRENLVLLAGFHDLTFSELSQRATLHDQSKFSKPEMTGYVFLNWIYHCQKIRLPFQPSPEMEIAIQKSLLHHRSHNFHHPEAHRSVLEMTELDVVEMVCDWHAISLENGTGPGSTGEWARQNKKRWSFSPAQDALIEETIEALEERRSGYSRELVH